MKKFTKLFLILILGTMFSMSAFTQATYYWIGKATGTGSAHDWQLADNWDPQRTVPATDDILIFDARHTGFLQDSVNNIPVQDIGTMKFDSGMFFFEAAGDSARLTIATLLYIDRYGGIDLKGWTNPQPANIWMDVNSVGTVNGTIIANNFVQLEGSLTTLGANSSDLTRKARFVNLAPGAWMTLETLTSLATELEIEDTIQLESTNDKYASLLMKGSPDPQITGKGTHFFTRYLFASPYEIKLNPEQLLRTAGKPVSLKKYSEGCPGEICTLTAALSGPNRDNLNRCIWYWSIEAFFVPSPTVLAANIEVGYMQGQQFIKEDGAALPTDGRLYKFPFSFTVPVNQPKLATVRIRVLKSDGSYCFIDGPLRIANCPLCPKNIYKEQTNSYLPLNHWETITDDFTTMNGGFHNIWVKRYVEKVDYQGKFNNGYMSTGTDTSSFDHQYQITGTYIQPWNLFNGWNLMGNPYPSSMNWGTDIEPVEGWTRTGIYNSFYIWNMELGQYAYFNGSGGGDSLNGGTRYIAPCQGFWIRADSAVGNYQLAVDNRVRCHTSTPYLKSTGNNPVNSLRVKVTGLESSDELLVRFNNQANQGIDAFDTYKFYGYKYAPQIYTIAENSNQMSINSYPEILKSLDIPMGFYIDTTGRFTLSFSQISSFPANVEIFFEDLKTGKLFKLQDSYDYVFDYKKGDDANRFIFHFSNKSYGMEDKENDGNIQIYSFNNIIYIRNYTEQTGKVVVYDVLGKIIMKRDFENHSLDNFKLDVPSGCYFVKVISGNKAYNHKVCL
jgi:hypothetical protein